MRMRVIPGHGRVFRAGHLLGYATEPIPGLAEIIETGGTDVFKQLAALIVAHEFNVAPFVVIQLGEESSALVFGAATLTTATSQIRGASSSTWSERVLDAEEVQYLAVGLADDTDAGHHLDTWLETGLVAGGGFVVGTPIKADTSTIDGDEPPVSAPAAPVDGQAPPAPAVISPPTFGTAAGSVNPARPAEPPPFDPFAEPSVMDLERIGAPSPVAPSPQAAAPPPPPPPPSPPLPPEPSDDTLIPLIPPTASVSPALPTDEPAAQTIGHLRFDDGQMVAVRQGIYVGRFPTKAGLPPNFDAIVIRSEHVSRVHWALIVGHDGQVMAEDLGSTSGTRLERPDGQVEADLAPNVGRRIEQGWTIHFGDRWAVFEA